MEIRKWANTTILRDFQLPKKCHQDYHILLQIFFTAFAPKFLDPSLKIQSDKERKTLLKKSFKKLSRTLNLNFLGISLANLLCIWGYYYFLFHLYSEVFNMKPQLTQPDILLFLNLEVESIRLTSISIAVAFSLVITTLNWFAIKRLLVPSLLIHKICFNISTDHLYANELQELKKRQSSFYKNFADRLLTLEQLKKQNALQYFGELK